jgi:5-formyltetrahydrofolate cyclo-ligase
MRIGILKKQLRTQLKREKNQLSYAQKQRESKQVFEAIEGLPEFQKVQHVLCYWSLPDELETTDFINKWFRKKHIYLPRVSGDKVEIVRYEGPETMLPGAFGILEPQGSSMSDPALIDLVIVPGMAFSVSGARMGRGGAYYDRLLPELKSAYRIGVCYQCQLINEIPVEIHDVSMDKVIVCDI